MKEHRMASPLDLLILLLLPYLLGSIPFGFLIAKGVKGIDIRQHGSGNIGATNVGRVLGAKWGLLALACDFLKGYGPVWGCAELVANSPIHSHARVIAGIATILGHMFPCWLGFKGGKGVATALGVVMCLSWDSSLVAAGIFALSFALWRIVSLGSILASVAFAVAHTWFHYGNLWSDNRWSLTVFSYAVPALIIVKHRSNIIRLWNGTETRYTTAKNKPSEEPPPSGSNG